MNNGVVEGGARLTLPSHLRSIALVLLLSGAHGALASTATEPDFTPIAQTDHSSPPTVIAERPDGRILASGDEQGEIAVWSRESLRQLRWMKAARKILLLHFSDAGLLSVDDSGTATLWDYRSGISIKSYPVMVNENLSKRGVSLIRGDSPKDWPVALSRSGRVLAVGQPDAQAVSIALYNVDSGALIDTFSLGRNGWGIPLTIRSMSFSSDDTALAVVVFHTFQILDLTTKSQRCRKDWDGDRKSVV